MAALLLRIPPQLKSSMKSLATKLGVGEAELWRRAAREFMRTKNAGAGFYDPNWRGFDAAGRMPADPDVDLYGADSPKPRRRKRK